MIARWVPQGGVTPKRPFVTILDESTSSQSAEPGPGGEAGFAW
jgi:hypothetical protein